MLILFLIISALVNVFLVWYLIYVLRKLVFVSNNIGGLFDTIQNYSEHVVSVYELEAFYGDETLQSLLEHSRYVVKEFEAYEEIYSLIEEGQFEEEVDEKEEIK